jgi:fluoroacetyl-CoA thioesterase
MSASDLRPGLRHKESVQVDDGLVVPAMADRFASFADMPPVFATAFVVGLIEWTCVEALKPYLDPAERTVGTHVDIAHVAATPLGMKATAEIELTSVEGRKLGFKVLCYDEAGVIGEGFHERAIVDYDRFMERAKSRSEAS